MSEAILTAYTRTEKPKVLRHSGFIPGVLAGKDYEKSIPVKFEEPALTKVINVHGPRAKLWVKFDGKKLFGVVDEIQKDSLSGAFVHIHIRMLSQNDAISVTLPITYTGLPELEHNNMMLLVHTHKINVTGKASIIPEHIVVNVKDANIGDIFHISDLKMDKSIKIHETADTILAVVEEKRFMEEPVVEETPAEAEPVAPTAETK